jgi:hypothetical protein
MEFRKGKEVYMEVPQGFELFIPRIAYFTFVKNSVWNKTDGQGVLAEIVRSTPQYGL